MYVPRSVTTSQPTIVDNPYELHRRSTAFSSCTKTTSPTCRSEDINTWSTAPPPTAFTTGDNTPFATGRQSNAITSHSSVSTHSCETFPRRVPPVRVTTSLRTS
jgi:hypothetical protein